MTDLVAYADDMSAAGPRFFALVRADDPNRVCYFGVDVGSGAFTVRRDPVTGQTNFGSWNSMTSALQRLDRLTGADGRMALLVFDSVPVAAVTALVGSDPFDGSTAALCPADPDEVEPS